MAKTISVTPYALRLKDTNNGNYLCLTSLPKAQTIVDVFGRYLADRNQSASINIPSGQALKALAHNSRAELMIDGLIQGGTFGYETEIQNVQTGKSTKRTPLDCEYLPFYFCLSASPGQNEAILVLQRFGAFGLKTILENDFTGYIDNIYQDVKLSMIC